MQQFLGGLNFAPEKRALGFNCHLKLQLCAGAWLFFNNLKI